MKCRDYIWVDSFRAKKTRLILKCDFKLKPGLKQAALAMRPIYRGSNQEDVFMISGLLDKSVLPGVVSFSGDKRTDCNPHREGQLISHVS